MSNTWHRGIAAVFITVTLVASCTQMASAVLDVSLWDKPAMSTVGTWKVDRATRSIRAEWAEYKNDESGGGMNVASVTYKLNGKAEDLRGTVFVGDGALDDVGFLCKIQGDGTEIDTIGEVRKGGSPADFTVPVRGISMVTIMVETSRGGGRLDVGFKNLRYIRASR